MCELVCFVDRSAFVKLIMFEFDEEEDMLESEKDEEGTAENYRNQGNNRASRDGSE